MSEATVPALPDVVASGTAAAAARREAAVDPAVLGLLAAAGDPAHVRQVRD